MAEALGIVGSIIAIIQITDTVVQYLSDVKDAPESRSKLLAEIGSTTGILCSLKALLDRPDPSQSWAATSNLLGGPGGSLIQFKLALESLVKRLEPKSGIKNFGKAIVWPFEKKQVNEILKTIERQKSMFIYALQNDHIQLSQIIHDEFVNGLHDLKLAQEAQRSGIYEIWATQALQENRLLGQEIQKLLSWLSPVNYWETQNDIFSRRQEGTGMWLLNTQEFKNWLNGDIKAIWCPGMAGAGKTIQSSIVVDFLQREYLEPDVGLAFVFFNYKDHKQTAKSVIASLLRQLLERSGSIPEETKCVLEKNASKQTHSSLEEYFKLLKAQIARFSRVYVIVDALDECSEQKGNRSDFMVGLQTIAPAIRLLVTSRSVGSIQEYMSSACHIEVRANDEDIKAYLVAQIERHNRLAKFCQDLELKKSIIDGVTSKARGMFLLAQLHMGSLAKEDNKRGVRKALERLPAEIKKTYDDTLERIAQQDPNSTRRARQVLMWLTYAQRPLSVKEFQHALAVELDDTDLDEDALPDPLDLVSVCAGLVIIDQESFIVRLVHYTAQEYFDSFGATIFPQAQQEIALTCITYMSFDIFGKFPVPEAPRSKVNGFGESNTDSNSRGSDPREFASAVEDLDFDEPEKKHPFAAYAATYWGNHVRNRPELECSDKLLTFLSNLTQTSFFAYLHDCFDSAKSTPGILLAALFGLRNTVRQLLERGMDLNSTDDEGRTALHIAATEGHDQLVDFLLAKNGINADPKDHGGLTPLHYAAETGHVRIVKMLLNQKGVDPNIINKYGQTPLHLAAHYGHEAVVEILLDQKGVDPNAADKYGQTPLHLGAWRGNEAVIKMLLNQKEVDFNAVDENDQTPLHLGTWRGHEAVIKMLLNQKGVDPNAVDQNDQTPLYYAARNKHKAVIPLFLERDDGLWKEEAIDRGFRSVWNSRLSQSTDGVVPPIRVTFKDGEFLLDGELIASELVFEDGELVWRDNKRVRK